MFEVEKAYPTFKSMTKPVIITTRDFVEHKVSFVLSVFSQMDKAIEMIFLRNIIHDSHANCSCDILLLPLHQCHIF